MGMLARLERESRSVIQSLGHPRAGLIEWFGGARAISGASVTPETALSVMAVYRAVRLIANTMACLPFGVYERKADGSKSLALKHPLSYVIRTKPNRWQTPFGWKQIMAGHLELRGNAYAEIFSDGRGRVTDLIPLHPDRVTPRSGVLSPEIGDAVWYEYRPPTGPMRIILWDEMFHLRGFSQDGLVGLSPITIAREAVGLAISNREYAARYLSNNSTPGGMLIHPKTLTPIAKENLRKSWESQHGSVHNTGKVAILEEAMQWQSIGFNPKESQFLEGRQFDNEEIARMFDLPPHMLMDLRQSTNNNIEHQGMEYVSNCILPRAVNMEETYDRDTLLPSDDGRFFIEANMEGLLRADSAGRAALYTSMFHLGAYSPNDIRRKENENPVEGGNEYFVPLNMVPLRMAVQLLEDQTKINPVGTPIPGDPVDPKALEPTPTSPSAARSLAIRSRIVRAHERLFVDALSRTLKKEVQAGRRALDRANTERSAGPLDAWIDDFYPDHERFTMRALEPIVQTAGLAIAIVVAQEVRLAIPDDGIPGLEELLRNAAGMSARAHVVASRAEIRRVLREVPGADRLATIASAFNDWDERRALREGPTEAKELGSVVGNFIYRMAGVPPIDPTPTRG